MSGLSAPVAALVLFVVTHPLVVLAIAVGVLLVVALVCRPAARRKTVVLDRDHFGRVVGRREVE